MISGFKKQAQRRFSFCTVPVFLKNAAQYARFQLFDLVHPDPYACIAWHTQIPSWRYRNRPDLWAVRQAGTLKLLGEKPPVKYFQPF